MIENSVCGFVYRVWVLYVWRNVRINNIYAGLIMIFSVERGGVQIVIFGGKWKRKVKKKGDDQMP